MASTAAGGTPAGVRVWPATPTSAWSVSTPSSAAADDASCPALAASAATARQSNAVDGKGNDTSNGCAVAPCAAKSSSATKAMTTSTSCGGALEYSNRPNSDVRTTAAVYSKAQRTLRRGQRALGAMCSAAQPAAASACAKRRSSRTCGGALSSPPAPSARVAAARGARRHTSASVVARPKGTEPKAKPSRRFAVSFGPVGM